MAVSSYTELAYIAWLVLIVIWIFQSFGNKRTAIVTHKGEQVVVFILMSIGFGLMFNQRVLPWGLSTFLFHPEAQSALLGDVFALSGVAFAIWARITLGKNWSGAAVTIKKDHQLIESGPYAYVRHPIYGGFLTAVIGTAFTIGTVASFLSPIFLLAVFALRIKREEEMLTRKFPNEYPSYITRTKALIPYLF